MQDERLTKIENEKQTALNEINNQYNQIINNSDKVYQDQIQASKDWQQEQQRLQQANTDFAIEKIEQQKQQAEKDYTKEQKGAYADYQKQVNDYGIKAEQMASSGLNNSGYSESSKVSMFNTYQNRVAVARESYGKAVLNYDNGIKDAMLQNNSALAEIAYNALQKQLEISLQGLQYKNSLLQDQINQKQQVESLYQSKWSTMLNQIQSEKELAEKVRQFNEQMAYQRQRDAIEDARYYASKSSSSSYGSSNSGYEELTNGGTNSVNSSSKTNVPAKNVATGSIASWISSMFK